MWSRVMWQRAVPRDHRKHNLPLWTWFCGGQVPNGWGKTSLKSSHQSAQLVATCLFKGQVHLFCSVSRRCPLTCRLHGKFLDTVIAIILLGYCGTMSSQIIGSNCALSQISAVPLTIIQLQIYTTVCIIHYTLCSSIMFVVCSPAVTEEQTKGQRNDEQNGRFHQIPNIELKGERLLVPDSSSQHKHDWMLTLPYTCFIKTCY